MAGRLGATALSIIIPTRNEAANIAPLLSAIDSALGRLDAEIIFVDDSSDETPSEILAAADSTHRLVRLLHRREGEREGGLGGAVQQGFRRCTGDWVVVMDGDLQHPPELVPDLLEVGQATGADIVVASRYVGSGCASGLANRRRSLVSRGTTALTRATFPRRLAACSDPMSGFFAVRRAAVDPDRLRPRGFKILLEIIARSPVLRLAEVPFEFGPRYAGVSKASLLEGVRFARKLVSLRVAASLGSNPSTLARAAGFAAVGASGIVVNSLALYLLHGLIGAHLWIAATGATQVSTLWNFLLADRLVFRGGKGLSQASRLLGFALVNNLLLLARLPILSLLVAVGMGYLFANLITLLAAFLVRFVISDRLLFRPGATMTLTPDRVRSSSGGAAATGSPTDVPQRRKGSPATVVIDLRESHPRPLATRLAAQLDFRYDVHGIVTLGSAVRLKELDAFVSPELEGPFDIEIRPGTVGDGMLRSHPTVTQFASPVAVSYQEHLGRRGSDFLVEMSDRIDVVVGPMLTRSPHVLYTNIVEALLRFVLVSRGYMLLHSACLELDGRGVMLSALTDTGKTGTILRLLREHDGRFLSDDMTVLRPDGVALAYPKPLTISHHTLRAVDAGELTRQEWRKLRVQSRLHSKQGRGIGARLGEMNLPIMSLNAVTQAVVPPPKYTVDRLVPCAHAREVKVEELFIIERNALALSEIDPEGLVDELIANTDDAYGFPPFAYFAPALVVDGMGYEELRAKERAILASALASGVRARRLATPDFSWATRIPQLLSGSVLALEAVPEALPAAHLSRRRLNPVRAGLGALRR